MHARTNESPGRPAGERRACWLMSLSLLSFSVALAACPGTRRVTPWTLEPSIEPQGSGTDALLIGTSVVNDSVVWVSGSKGTWLRTTNGGATWEGGTVPGADSLEFRDVHAFDAENAFLLSIGTGDQSRIYRTSDAGETWALTFRNDEPRGFFDCFDFWDARHGMAFSDSVDGEFLLIETADGGATWTRIPADRLPPAREGEGAFAASGTCLVVRGDATAWIGTGASDGGARVLRTTDRGRTWSVAETPIVKGTSAGIASLAFRNERHGAALGGDIAEPDSPSDNVALTRDGGETWTLGGRPTFTGAVYGSSWVPGAPEPTLVAVGPKGVSYSTDGGVGWAALDTLNHWGVAFASPERGWAVGPEGRISRLRLYRRR